MSKSLVRPYEYSFDAQKIYEKLQANATKSTQATIDTEELLVYLTSTKLNKTQWRGTHHAFVLHWCDQLRKYEGLIDKNDRFTSNVKIIMLQNAVSKVSELYSVKKQAAHDIAHGWPPLTYHNYTILLLSAATVEDGKLSFSSTRPQRTVQAHEQVHFIGDNDTTFNIDTDVNKFVVHSTDRIGRPPPKDIFRPSMTRGQ